MRIQAMKQYLLAILASYHAGISAFEFQNPITEAQRTISQPLLGFGTWNLKVSPENTSAAVSIAIQTGYRQIDCAAAYRNEKAVGEGIRDGLKKANLTRDQIWVTSKLWNDQ
jgi:alcohol dehydrogenase (NADP+)